MGSLLDAALFAYGQNPVMGARMIQTSGQGISPNTYTTVTYQSVEFDTSGTAIANAGAGTLTATMNGLWVVSGTLSFGTAAAQAGYWFAANISRNSTSGGELLGVASTLAFNGAVGTTPNVSAVVRLSVGDVLRLQGYQNYTAAVNTQQLTCFQMAYLGPA